MTFIVMAQDVASDYKYSAVVIVTLLARALASAPCPACVRSWAHAEREQRRYASRAQPRDGHTGQLRQVDPAAARFLQRFTTVTATDAAAPTS